MAKFITFETKQLPTKGFTCYGRAGCCCYYHRYKHRRPSRPHRCPSCLGGLHLYMSSIWHCLFCGDVFPLD